MTTRINARLDDELAAKLEVIRRRTGQTLTAIVEAALEAYVARETTSDALKVFEANGFVGVSRGPADLARKAKKHLKASLEKRA